MVFRYLLYRVQQSLYLDYLLCTYICRYNCIGFGKIVNIILLFFLADICRIKWGHLRDNFRKVFIRNTLSAEPPTTWRFYNDMRFMEAAVAENVMRHHRLREQSLYWQELHTAEQRKCSTTSTHSAPNDSYERSLQNNFNFSEISAFFQTNGTTSKRIKVETSESETSLNDTAHAMPNAFVQNGSAYEKPDRYPLPGNIIETENGHNNTNADVGDADDDDDDDDFDEDATSVDEGYHLTSNDNKISENNFTTNFQNYNQSSKAVNTEMCENLNEQDSDRMFLLSLLPYLRKVKDQRKLHVRQKLQDVLIQEFG